MHLLQLSRTSFFGFLWIVLGLLWIRRAYVGERPGVLVTLQPSLNRTMNRRDRVMALFLGGAFLLMGTAQLLFTGS
jgi:hypothetical protein